MCPLEDASYIEPESQVFYRSFLLRLRLVSRGEEQRKQYFLKDIRTQEEFYFASEDELIGFLYGLMYLPQDQEP